MSKHWIMGIASAAALCAMSAVANAGPAPSAAALGTAVQQSSTVAKVADRGWRSGRSRAFGYGYTSGYSGYGGYAYGPSAAGYAYGYGSYPGYSGYARDQTSYGYGDFYVPPDNLRTGSAEWWRIMDEDGRGGLSD